MTIKSPEKSDLISQLNSQRADPICILMLRIIALEIDELRLANDDADVNEIIANQGEIRAFKKIDRHIRQGLIV